MKKLSKETLLKDALYNLAPRSGASLDYCTGLVVGVVSTLMAEGMSFGDAIVLVALHMPHGEGTRLAVPDCWQEDLKMELRKLPEVYIQGIRL